MALVCSPAFAKDWIYCRSPHFEAYQEVTEAGRGSCDLDKWEAYWYFFSFVYGPAAESDRLVRVVIFNHLSGQEGSDSPVGRGDALFLRSETRDYLVLRESKPPPHSFVSYFPVYETVQEPYEPPRHNDKRAYIRLRLSEFSLPVWFAAGLETLYMGGLGRGNGELFLRGVSEVEHPAIDKLLAAIGTPKTMGVTAFGGRRERYRSKAKSLALMLHTHDDYHDRYREFVSTLAEGASSDEAIQLVYGKSLDQVDRDLREYWKVKHGGVLSTPVRPEIPPTSMRPVTDSEETEMMVDMRTALASGQVERFK